ncbi:Non-specific lipid-transfer protein (Fragments) [Linum grandiflorum]
MATPGCCGGVKKNFAAGASSINYGLAAGLPGRCGVNVGFPISPSVDCNS